MKLTNDLISLAFQAPYVIALRCQQLAASTLFGSPGNTPELQRMVSEKAAAFVESTVSWNTALTAMNLALIRNFWLGRRLHLSHRQSTQLIGRAVGPYAKRVRANSRRLSRH
ncbi:hypothetical protein [Roseibium sp. M-1]